MTQGKGYPMYQMLCVLVDDCVRNSDWALPGLLKSYFGRNGDTQIERFPD
jgi:hypothetical protein